MRPRPPQLAHGVGLFGGSYKRLYPTLLGATSHVMWPSLFSLCLDCSPEAQPKYVRGGKRYGRRSLPEFQESGEEIEEVTVLEPLEEEARSSPIPAGDCGEVRRSVTVTRQSQSQAQSLIGVGMSPG